jgi:hypothetical protein
MLPLAHQNNHPGSRGNRITFGQPVGRGRRGPRRRRWMSLKVGLKCRAFGFDLHELDQSRVSRYSAGTELAVFE